MADRRWTRLGSGRVAVRRDRPRARGCWRAAAAGPRSSRRSAPWSCSAALAALFLLAPGSAEVRHTFFDPRDMWQSFIGNPKKGYYSVGAAIWLNIRMFLAAEVLILILALALALIRQSVSPVLFPLRVLGLAYVDFFRGVPTLLVILAVGLGRPGPAAGGPVQPARRRLRRGRPGAVLHRLRQRGLPGGPGLGAPEPARRGPVAGPVPGHGAALRGPAAGGPQHHPAAAQRLHQPAEGHGPGRRARRDRGQPGGRRSTAAPCSTSPASPWPPSCS